VQSQQGRKSRIRAIRSKSLRRGDYRRPRGRRAASTRGLELRSRGVRFGCGSFGTGEEESCVSLGWCSPSVMLRDMGGHHACTMSSSPCYGLLTRQSPRAGIKSTFQCVSAELHSKKNLRCCWFCRCCPLLLWDARNMFRRRRTPGAKGRTPRRWGVGRGLWMFRI
jgi:hypothetical protein